MGRMTIDELREVLVACAGETDNVDLRGNIEDRDFEVLGYDSLALMETAARIEQKYGVHVPEGQIMAIRTPREMLDLVNRAAVEPS